MSDVPRSERFDDVYFSAQDGLGETNHVFIENNHLPAAWQGRDDFVIAETGFGTGLNFLCAWKLFCETASPDQHLHFVSIERYPLSADQIRQGLARWKTLLGPYLDQFLARYQMLVPGFHRMDFANNVHLTLIIGDANDVLPDLDAQVDCWFLDGFTPAKNPEMWTDTVFQNMARLSRPGATFATFTAAGDVRRGLEAAGFYIERRPGFGRKRDMLAGRYTGVNKTPRQKPKRVAIIGGGLAGTSCAYALKQYGIKPVLYEAGETLAAGASGNALGLYNPRFSAFRTPEAELYINGYVDAFRAFQGFDDIDFNPCGALHLINTPEKDKRFHSMIGEWDWSSDHMRLVGKDEASDIAGIKVDQDALYLPDSGSVCPEKICHAYARDVEVHLKTDVQSLDALDADAVILACGIGVKHFLPDLPVHTVRGQISEIKASEITQNLKCNLHFGGYLSAHKDGRHVLGATFQKWLGHTDVLKEDHDANIVKLKENVPVLKHEEWLIVNGRASMRTASRDHLPVIGVVPGFENVYVSTAHGSHGLVTSLAAARMLADIISNAPIACGVETTSACGVDRFAESLKSREN